jgi:hypothetical protein
VHEISVRSPWTTQSRQSDTVPCDGRSRKDRPHRPGGAQRFCYGRCCSGLLAITICSVALSGCEGFFVRNSAHSGESAKAGTPALSTNSTSLAFGSVHVNTSATQSVTLTSAGTAPVTISTATTTGQGFTMSGITFPVTLDPGQTMTLSLQFDPLTTGAATGQVRITTNSSTNGTVEIGLSGTGTSHEVDLSWDAPISSDPLAGYRIYRSSDGGTSFQLVSPTLVTQNTFLDVQVQSGMTYHYVVKSVNTLGVESAPSNLTSVTIP